MTFEDHLKHVNAGTHKRVFYRIIKGSDTEVEIRLSELANKINECNGRVYGSQPMHTSTDDYVKVIISFEIPSLAIDKFLGKS